MDHAYELTPRGTFTQGPTERAGYTFFGHEVWRTAFMATMPASATTITIGNLPGVGDLVHVWGCCVSTSTGRSYAYQGWSAGNTWIARTKVNPTTGDVTVQTAADTAGGNGANYTGPGDFTGAKIVIVVFWTRGQ